MNFHTKVKPHSHRVVPEETKVKEGFEEPGDSIESQLSLKMPANALKIISKNKMEEGIDSDMEIYDNGIDKNLRLK